MDHNRTIKLILLLWMAQFIILLVMLPNSIIQDALRSEVTSAQRWIGPAATLWVEDRAYSTHRALMRDTGAYDAMKASVTRPEHTRELESNELRSIGFVGDELLPYLSSRIDVLMAMILLVIVRVTLLILWWPYLAIWLACSYIDGHLQRKAFRNSWQHASHVLHGFVIKFAKIFGILILVMLFLPFNVPAIAYPMIGVILGAIITTAVSHLQKTI